MPGESNKAIVRWLCGPALSRAGLPEDAAAADRGYQPGDDERTDAPESVYGCADPPGRRRTDPYGSGKQYGAGDRDRNGKLPYFCG